MTTAPDNERIARLEERAASHEAFQAEMRDGLREIRDFMSRANGGLKVILWIGTIFVSGGILSRAVSWLAQFGPHNTSGGH